MNGGVAVLWSIQNYFRHMYEADGRVVMKVVWNRTPFSSEKNSSSTWTQIEAPYSQLHSPSTYQGSSKTLEAVFRVLMRVNF